MTDYLMWSMAFFAALSVFLFMYTSAPPTGKKVEERLAKYLTNNQLNQIYGQVYTEKLAKTRQNKIGKIELGSKELANQLAMAGIKLSATEFLYFWIGTTFVPMLLLILLGGSPVSAVALVLVGFLIPPLYVQQTRKKRQVLFQNSWGKLCW